MVVAAKNRNTFVVGKDVNKSLREWWLYQLGLSATNTVNSPGTVCGWKRLTLPKTGIDFDTGRVNRALQEDEEKREQEVAKHQWNESVTGRKGQEGQGRIIICADLHGRVVVAHRG